MKNTISLGLVLALFFAFTFSNAQELHTHSNAASIANESNSTIGWGGNLSVTSVSEESYSGNYSIKFVADANGWELGWYDLNLIVGDEYEIIIYAKKTANSPNPSLTNWDGFGNFYPKRQSITSTSWQEYKFNVIASETTGRIKVYTGTQATIGNTVYIDNVSIRNLTSGTNTDTDTQAPIAPSLTENGKTETTVNLNWTGATDNVGVTGYNLFQDGTEKISNLTTTSYTVSGLTENTTYQFTVKALDAAGNESANSNTVSVTTDAASNNEDSTNDDSTGDNTSGGGGSTTSVWSESNGTANYNGNVAIGTNSVPSGYQLAVEGKIRTREVRVDQDTWPDYVFKEEYHLPSLEDIQKHIKEKGHLPNIPSAKEVEENGIELGEMNKLLLEKIEELTLYILKQEERIKILEQKNR